MVDIIETNGIIVRIIPYGETSLVVDAFTEEAGLLKGYVKGGRQKRNSGIYQKGNLVFLSHQRRLSEQLGTITAETQQCLWHDLSQNRLAFKIFHVLCDLKAMTLPVSVAETQLYNAFLYFINILYHTQDTAILWRHYIDYLIIFLQQVGYAPDFSRCVVSGQKNDLVYVSPKSLHAVSQEVGKPYHDKLLRLPAFFLDSDVDVTQSDIDDGLKILQCCFEKFIFFPKNIAVLDLMIRDYNRV